MVKNDDQAARVEPRVMLRLPAARCDWCGQFTRDYRVHQPHTESWKLEPEDPQLLCLKCAKEAA